MTIEEFLKKYGTEGASQVLLAVGARASLLPENNLKQVGLSQEILSKQGSIAIELRSALEELASR